MNVEKDGDLSNQEPATQHECENDEIRKPDMLGNHPTLGRREKGKKKERKERNSAQRVMGTTRDRGIGGILKAQSDSQFAHIDSDTTPPIHRYVIQRISRLDMTGLASVGQGS